MYLTVNTDVDSQGFGGRDNHSFHAAFIPVLRYPLGNSDDVPLRTPLIESAWVRTLEFNIRCLFATLGSA